MAIICGALGHSPDTVIIVHYFPLSSLTTLCGGYYFHFTGIEAEAQLEGDRTGV